MAYRYATVSDDTSTWTRQNPAMGTDARRWTEHVLDGRRYRLRCRWIEKASLWLLDVLDRQGNPLLVGLPVRVGQSLMLPHVGEELPGFGFGQIVAIDTSKQGQEAGRDDLGVLVWLVYVPAVET